MQMPPIKYIDGALWQNTHGYLAHKLVKPSVPKTKSNINILHHLQNKRPIPKTNSNINIHQHISKKHKNVKRSNPKTNSKTFSHLGRSSNNQNGNLRCFFPLGVGPPPPPLMVIISRHWLLHRWDGFYTWSQSKILLLSPLIIGSKLTFISSSGRWLPTF